MTNKISFAIVFGLAALLLLPGIVFAQTNFTGTTDNTWGDATNWDNGLPSTGPQNANIADGFTISLSSDQSCDELDLVGDQSSGIATINHTAGTLTHNGGWMKIGVNSGNTGTYNMSGTATVNNSGSLYLGQNGGFATFDMSGEASYTGLGFNAGLNSNSNVVVFVSDSATLDVTDLNLGNAIVFQTGGQVSVQSWLAVGKDGGTGIYQIAGGTLTQSSAPDYFTIGETENGQLLVSGSSTVTATNSSGMIVGRYNGVGFQEITGSSATVNVADLRVGVDENQNDNSANGNLRWVADSSGISPIVSADNTEFSPGDSKLSLDFSADPLSLVNGTQYLLINNAAAVSGTFAYRPEGSFVDFGSGTGTISYVGGTDNFDIVVTVAAAPPLTALSTFCTDFEDLVPGQELSPLGDGWQFFHTNGGFPDYDGFAPQGPQICNLADEDGNPGFSLGQTDLGGAPLDPKGGGNKYLNMYSDYNNPQPTESFTNRVFQEQAFTGADAANEQTWMLSFDYAGAEPPFFPGASGSATTAAFIRVLDNNGTTLAEEEFDTSAAASQVFNLGKVSLTFDAAWTNGGIVQFGFKTERTQSDPCGIYYDNVCFGVLGDANNDGVFNNFDIASFVLALTSTKTYAMMFPDVDPDGILDMDCSGEFNNQDIAAFVAALTGP